MAAYGVRPPRPVVLSAHLAESTDTIGDPGDPRHGDEYRYDSDRHARRSGAAARQDAGLAFDLGITSCESSASCVRGHSANVSRELSSCLGDSSEGPRGRLECDHRWDGSLERDERLFDRCKTAIVERRVASPYC